MLNKNQLLNYASSGAVNPDVEPHIPITCHFDPRTLLTKTGDLVQIIEITGFDTSGNNSLEYEDLRATLRKVIAESIPSYKYAVYFHTTRSRKNLMPAGVEPFGFADELNKTWCKVNNWDKQLVNTVYVSIVRQGKPHYIFDMKQNLQSLLTSIYKKTQKKYFDQACIELTEVTNNIIAKLKTFGSKALEMVETENGYISEPLLFYSQLLHLEPMRTNVPIKDLADYLSDTKISFTYNSMEVITERSKQFAAVFTFKDCYDLPIAALNKFLQLGIQFNVCQSIVFVNSYVAKKKYEDMKFLADLSNDSFLLKESGFENFLKADQGKPTDYCLQQTTLVIRSDDYKFFEMRVKQAVRVLSEIGVNFAREDLLMPSQFYAQLPGNFRYLPKKRMTYTDRTKIASFCTILHHDSGYFKGSKWGAPISLLRNADGTPFFVNYHNKSGNGNTLITGPEGSGKTILARFLLAQSVKLNPRIIYLDLEGNSQKFIEVIGGKYFDFKDGISLQLNPFKKSNFADNPELFKKWLQDSIFAAATKNNKYEEFFATLATKLFEGQNLTEVRKLIQEVIDSTKELPLQEGFKKVFSDEVFNKYFVEGEENLSIFEESNIMAINLAGFLDDLLLKRAYLGLIVGKTLSLLDGKPTIILVNRAHELFDVASFYPTILKWADEIRKKNGIAFISLRQDEELREIPEFVDFCNSFDTRLFMSDKTADKYFMRAFKLTDNELFKIKSYDKSRHMFLLKQDAISSVLGINLGDIKDILRILAEK